MAHPKPDLYEHNIVVVGTLNPLLFHPAWFRKHNLLPAEDIGEEDEDGDSKALRLMHPAIAGLVFDWGNLEIRPEQWIGRTNSEDTYELLRDLAIGTFRVLSNAEVKAVGLNFQFHFDLKSKEKYERFLKIIGPHDNWRSLLGEVTPVEQSFDILREQNDYPGGLRMQVSPSVQIENGIFFRLNDHYDLSTEEKTETGLAVVRLLNNEWLNSKKRTFELIQRLLSEI